jgi:UDP-N-acetyl-D-glucosamine dehydrogenase
MNYQEKLIGTLNRKSAVIGIIGLGYVGLPLVIRFIEEGFRVLGIDIDDAKVKKLNAGKSYIEHIPTQAIRRCVKAGFHATTNFAEARKADALIICVPTPLDEHREPDLSYVIGTVESLIPNIRAGQIMSLESTTYPGTTDEELLPRIQRRGFTVGKDYFLVFSPEREDPGNKSFNTRTIPKVCGGDTPACRAVGESLYSQVIDRVVPVGSTRVAEMTKLLENIHRSVNIGLVNEMKIVADSMGIDIHEVIAAASTKPFGFVPYQPGPGLGGHCIPIDPFYLTWKAREYGVHTRFIELAGEVNSGMPEWVINKVADALNERGKSVKGSKILVLGISYKKDVDDPRESPSMILLEKLRKRGAKFAYSDPYFPSFPKMREHHFDLKSVSLTPRNIASFDCILLATNHTAFDYKKLKKHAKLLVDTRGIYLKPAKNIVKA